MVKVVGGETAQSPFAMDLLSGFAPCASAGVGRNAAPKTATPMVIRRDSRRLLAQLSGSREAHYLRSQLDA